MKSWKKRWQEELDSAIPALSEEVKNEPIEVREKIVQEETVSPKKPWYTMLFATPRRLASCISGCIVAVVVAGGALYFALRPQQPITQTSNDDSVPPTKTMAGLISIEVNPQAVFSVDENGKVTAVMAANADADVVLSENRSAEMQGKTVEEAVEIFVDYTAKLGYLDLSEPDAVRVTACEEDERLASVGEALKEYFCEKGAYIAVAEETVGIEDFCARTGLVVTETVEMLSESVKNLPDLFFERSAQGKNVEELQTLYREYVSEEKIKGMLEKSLNEGVEKVEQRKADLEAIDALSNEILAHKDNGIFLHKDYWALMKEAEPLTEALQALCMEMTAKLAVYKERYGKEIDSLLTIASEKLDCASQEWVNIWKGLTDFTMDAFRQYFTLFTDSLKALKIDIAWLSELYQTPKDISEYLSRTQLYTEKLFAERAADYREKYEAARETVTATEYESYMAQIVAEYGDLSKYWKSFQ